MAVHIQPGFIRLEFSPKETLSFEILHPSMESSRSWSERLLCDRCLSGSEFGAILVSHSRGRAGSCLNTCPHTGLVFYLSCALPIELGFFPQQLLSFYQLSVRVSQL